jgi:predicted PolB exonuclease-like 3'-5' exonuclease
MQNSSVTVKRVPNSIAQELVVIERFDEQIEIKEPTFSKNVKGFPVVQQIASEDIEPSQNWKKQWNYKEPKESKTKHDTPNYIFDRNGDIQFTEVSEGKR